MSPRNGAIRECKAVTKPCPYGGEYHADTKEAAYAKRQELIETHKVTRGSIETVLRPKGSSTSGFMGMFENYDEVVTNDMATLHKHGVFPADLGEILKKMGTSRTFPRINNPNPHDISPEHIAADVTVNITPSMFMGFQECPWRGKRDYKDKSCNEATSGHNISIKSPRGEIYTNQLMAHLISHHNFFQGRHSDHRMDPERLLHVLGWR